MDIVDITGSRLADSVYAPENNRALKPVEAIRSKVISRRNSTYEDAELGYRVTISAQGRLTVAHNTIEGVVATGDR